MGAVMLSCDEARRLIAADVEGRLEHDADGRIWLESHTASCAACAADLLAQRQVAGLLRGRPPAAVPPFFAARVRARLDEEDRGWLGLADWRAWTLRLTPVATALILALYVGLASVQDPAAAWTLDDWAAARAGGSSAPAVLWEAEPGSEILLEALLTGDPAGEMDR